MNWKSEKTQYQSVKFHTTITTGKRKHPGPWCSHNCCRQYGFAIVRFELRLWRCRQYATVHRRLCTIGRNILHRTRFNDIQPTRYDSSPTDQPTINESTETAKKNSKSLGATANGKLLNFFFLQKLIPCFPSSVVTRCVGCRTSYSLTGFRAVESERKLHTTKWH